MRVLGEKKKKNLAEIQHLLVSYLKSKNLMNCLQLCNGISTVPQKKKTAFFFFLLVSSLISEFGVLQQLWGCMKCSRVLGVNQGSILLNLDKDHTDLWPELCEILTMFIIIVLCVRMLTLYGIVQL